MLVYDLDFPCLDGWAMHKARAMGVFRLQFLVNHCNRDGIITPDWRQHVH